MIRSVVLAALALAVLAPTRAGAQPPFDPTPGGFRIVDAKADKGKLQIAHGARLADRRELRRSQATNSETRAGQHSSHARNINKSSPPCDARRSTISST